MRSIEISNKSLIGKVLTINHLHSVEKDIKQAFAQQIPAAATLRSEKQHLKGQLTHVGFLDLAFGLSYEAMSKHGEEKTLEVIDKFKSLVFGQKQDEILVKRMWQSLEKADFLYDPRSLAPLTRTGSWENNPESLVLLEKTEESLNPDFFKEDGIIIRLFLKAKHPDFSTSGLVTTDEGKILERYFPLEFTVIDACLSNVEHVWVGKYEYA